MIEKLQNSFVVEFVYESCPEIKTGMKALDLVAQFVKKKIVNPALTQKQVLLASHSLYFLSTVD